MLAAAGYTFGYHLSFIFKRQSISRLRRQSDRLNPQGPSSEASDPIPVSHLTQPEVLGLRWQVLPSSYFVFSSGE